MVPGLRYKVLSTNVNGHTRSYHVTNQTDSNADWPDAAVFHVSYAYPKEFQKKQADRFCDYMNKIQEAAEKAFDQQYLIDVMARNNTP